MKNNQYRSANALLTALLISILCTLSPSSVASLTVEEWLDPIVDIEFMDGRWQLVESLRLPKPPIVVLQQQNVKVLVKLRRIGLVWLPRASIRLSEEKLKLSCQKTQTSRAGDYQNFGMRGEGDFTLKCISEQND